MSSRRGASSTLLILGLANPGSDYEGSRHNVGGDAVRLVVQRRGLNLSLEKRQRALIASCSTSHGLVTLAVPTTYMNESGAALRPLLQRTSITDISRVVIVHDELDFAPGRLQIKTGGGLAGHNGLRSIAGVVGTQEFTRLRIGIGKPPHKDQGADFVLKRLTGPARTAVELDVAAAADAIELILDVGLTVAQQQVNAGMRG